MARSNRKTVQQQMDAIDAAVTAQLVAGKAKRIASSEKSHAAHIAAVAAAAGNPLKLNADLSNLASFAAVECDTMRGKTEEGKPNPAAHVLPDTLTAVVNADTKLDKIWLVYSEAATAAGLRTSMLPPGAKFGSGKATPEYNMLYLTIARAKFGENCAAVMGAKEAIKASKEEERKTQQVRIGAVVSKVRGYLERHYSEQVAANEGTPAGNAATEATTKRGTKKRTNAAQAALDGETIILLKEVKDAILAQPKASKTLLAFTKRIDALLNKAAGKEEVKEPADKDDDSDAE